MNALSDDLTVEVAREKQLHVQHYKRGKPTDKLKNTGAVNRRGTTIRFHADPEIFGPQAHFKAARLYRMCRSKAYLFRGVEIRWSCDPSLIAEGDDTPASDTLHFPGGLGDYLTTTVNGRKMVTATPFVGAGGFPRQPGPRRMGDRLAGRWRRLPQLLLQHGADPRRRHP